MSIDWDDLVLGPVMAVFGEEVIYTPRGGAPITIPDAVFDEENYDVDIGADGQEVNLKKPIVGIRAAALNGYDPKQNDRVTISRTGQSFIVKNPNPDGHGHIVLLLMAAS
jgi:hypothetical protein